jgi:hypothetical protein
LQKNTPRSKKILNKVILATPQTESAAIRFFLALHFAGRIHADW